MLAALSPCKSKGWVLVTPHFSAFQPHFLWPCLPETPPSGTSDALPPQCWPTAFFVDPLVFLDHHRARLEPVDEHVGINLLPVFYFFCGGGSVSITGFCPGILVSFQDIISPEMCCLVKASLLPLKPIALGLGLNRGYWTCLPVIESITYHCLKWHGSSQIIWPDIPLEPVFTNTSSQCFMTR